MVMGVGNPVLQDWVCNISWKKQTVLLGALRAPDVITTLAIKEITIWIRLHVLENADPMTGFMHGSLQKLPLFEHIDREFERLPLHCAHHILLAMQVIAREHPELDIASNVYKFYHDAINAQHLNVETRQQYEARYRDQPDRIKTGIS